MAVDLKELEEQMEKVKAAITEYENAKEDLNADISTLRRILGSNE